MKNIPKPAPEPVAPSSEEDSYRRRPPTPRPAPLPPQIDIDEIQTRLDQDIHLAEAEARLAEYEAQGLLQDNHNKNLLIDFVNAHTKTGLFSREIVDAAVANLGPRGTNALHWAKPKPTPVVAALPLADKEVLGILPNGEPMLSIKRPPPSTASPTQIRDYLKRYRASNNLIYLSFGR